MRACVECIHVCVVVCYCSSLTSALAFLSLQSNIPNYIEIPVRRDRLMEDSFFHIMRVKNVEHLKARVMIKFQGEEGLDFGGLSR